MKKITSGAGKVFADRGFSAEEAVVASGENLAWIC